MAARDHRALHLALLMFATLSVALGVTTYVVFSKYDKQRQEITTVQARAARQQLAAEAALRENRALKLIIGHADIAELHPAIRDAHLEDTVMVRSGESFDRLPSYRNHLAHLVNVARTLGGREISAIDRADRLKQRISDIEANANRQFDIYLQEIEKISQDRKHQFVGFHEDRQTFNRQKDALAERLALATGDVAQWEIAYDRLQRTFNTRLGKLQQRLDRVVDELHTHQTVDFDKLDGAITHVSQRSGRVQVDLGSDDKLRPGLVFDVYGVRGGGVTDREPKGRIEITKLLGAHSAEGRIMEDRIVDPILSGDRVNSKIWQPGEGVHFALAGFLDLDGDGKSDRRKVRLLIERQGGVIDAEVDDEGNRTGQLTHHTRYLVIGRPPRVGVESRAQFEAYSRIVAEAEKFRTQQIPLERIVETRNRDARVVSPRDATTGASDSGNRQ